MGKTTKTPNPLTVLVALAAAAAGMCLGAAAQSAPAVGVVSNVGVEPGKPFTGQWVTRWVNTAADGKERASEMNEFVARDSSGRIRFDKRGVISPGMEQQKLVLNTREGGTITTTQAEARRVILIFDCVKGRQVTLQPGMQIAQVRDSPAAAQPGTRAFSSYFTSLAHANMPPNLAFEDLGAKQVEGFMASGYRTTELGTEEDAEANGKPVRIHEVWVSDDLAATLVEIWSSPGKKSESRSRLIHIAREEPDLSLFEIPDGYKVNPPPGEVPFRRQQKP